MIEMISMMIDISSDAVLVGVQLVAVVLLVQ